jgi:hypothetical protein
VIYGLIAAIGWGRWQLLGVTLIIAGLVLIGLG